jgi:hypothetical protein
LEGGTGKEFTRTPIFKEIPAEWHWRSGKLKSLEFKAPPRKEKGRGEKKKSCGLGSS